MFDKSRFMVYLEEYYEELDETSLSLIDHVIIGDGQFYSFVEDANF